MHISIPCACVCVWDVCIVKTLGMGVWNTHEHHTTQLNKNGAHTNDQRISRKGIHREETDDDKDAHARVLYGCVCVANFFTLLLSVDVLLLLLITGFDALLMVFLLLWLRLKAALDEWKTHFAPQSPVVFFSFWGRRRMISHTHTNLYTQSGFFFGCWLLLFQQLHHHITNT